MSVHGLFVIAVSGLLTWCPGFQEEVIQEAGGRSCLFHKAWAQTLGEHHFNRQSSHRACPDSRRRHTTPISLWEVFGGICGHFYSAMGDIMKSFANHIKAFDLYLKRNETPFKTFKGVRDVK